MEDIICIAGKNQIAINATQYLLKNLHIHKEFLRVITNSDDTGTDDWQPSFKKFASNNALQIINLKDAYTIKNLIFISLEFDKIINPKEFQTKKLYNLHFSLLPAYKGMYTAILPILKGETKSGVSFHLIDEGIDTGDIIRQKTYDITLQDTAYTLYSKNLDYAFLLFKETIGDILKNKIKATKQSYLGASYYSKNTIDFKNIHIDLNKTSFEIYNQIRAFIFPPYQLPKIDGKEIYKCVLSDEKIAIRKNFLHSHFIISGIDGFKILAYTI